MARFMTSILGRIEDAVTDRAVRNLDARIKEITSVPVVAGKLITGVTLTDGVETAVRHGLGRRCTVFISPIRGASTSGRVEEMRATTTLDHDPKNAVVLKASGYGATVTVDLWVF